MKTGFVVFIRNLLIAISGFIFISKGVKHLPESEAAFLLIVMVIINAQNALYEGLFLTHTMSMNDIDAKSVLRKQSKFIFLVPIFTLIVTVVYGYFALNYHINYMLLFVIYFCYLLNLLSLSATNVFCTNTRYMPSFIFDIIFTFLAVLIVIKCLETYTLYIALSLRVLGSALGGSKFLLYHSANEGDDQPLPIISFHYFTGSFLSFLRDSVTPLIIGFLAGPAALIGIRIFNTCCSAPGLIAGAMNKIVIRYAHKRNGFTNIALQYLVTLYVLSLGYLVMWFIGGKDLYIYLLGSKEYFRHDIFILSLALFCVFWPLGQYSISKIIYSGKSRLFLFISYTWTIVSIGCLISLISFNISAYILLFGGAQIINVFILLYVRKRITSE